MEEKIFTVVSTDGYPIQVKLSIPKNFDGNKLVLFVNASGPFTYNTKRQNPNGGLFNYFHLFANEFTCRGIAFCRYSTRGVSDGDDPPYFSNINEEEYKTYLPHNSIADIECLIKHLKNNGFENTALYLLGWSEGTIIAPLIVQKGVVKIDALLLAGYCNENLRDTLIWQLNGNTLLLQWRRLFDYDCKGYVTRTDFEEDRFNIRQTVFGDQPFDAIDLNGDGKITIEDAVPLSVPYLNDILYAIDINDDEWLKNNHGIHLTSAWFKEHFSLVGNKNVLPELDLPIHIFAGDYDSMTPIKYAYDIEKIFKEKKKSNLTVHSFKNHDHDLNYLFYFLKGKLSTGMKEIIDTVERL